MKENITSTAIYLPQPSYFYVKYNGCSGDGLRKSSYAGQRPGVQEGSGHHMARFVSSTFSAVAFKPLLTPAHTDRAQSPSQQDPSQGEERALHWTAGEPAHTCEPSLPGRSWRVPQPRRESQSLSNAPKVQTNKPDSKPSKVPHSEARRSYKHRGVIGKKQRTRMILTALTRGWLFLTVLSAKWNLLKQIFVTGREKVWMC